MTERTRIRFWTLAWLFLFPVLFIGFIPWQLAVRFDGPLVWYGGVRQWIGAWLILNGAALAGWCVYLFITQGRGTPLPTQPPKRFLVAGPYRFVRNPMAIGFFLILGGEALVYSSAAVFFYLLFIVLVIHCFVRFVEEPDLQRRFGQSYLFYRYRVKRWLPQPPDGRCGGTG